MWCHREDDYYCAFCSAFPLHYMQVVHSLSLYFLFVLTQRMGSRKTNLRKNCVGESLQKIIKFFSFILCLIILMISAHIVFRIRILRLSDSNHVPL